MSKRKKGSVHVVNAAAIQKEALESAGGKVPIASPYGEAPQVETCTIGVDAMGTEEHQPTPQEAQDQESSVHKSLADMWNIVSERDRRLLTLETASQGSERICWQPELPTDRGALELTIQVYDSNSQNKHATTEKARVEFLGTRPVWFVQRLNHPSDRKPLWVSLLSVYGGDIGIAEVKEEENTPGIGGFPPGPTTEPLTADPAQEVLEKAIKIVTGARRHTYGNPEDNFKCIADLWGAYWNRATSGRSETSFKPHDVAMMMALVKIARLAEKPDHEDSAVDLAGYAACHGRCVAKQGV